MEFFLHNTLNRYSVHLNQIKKHFGIAGLGFYWRAVEKLMWDGQKIEFETLANLRGAPLRYLEAKEIIFKSGLFAVDRDMNVWLAKEEDNGIAKQTMDSYFEKLIVGNSTNICPKSWIEESREAASRIRAGVPADTSTDLSADVSASAGADADADTGAADGADERNLDKDKDRDEDIDEKEDLSLREAREKLEIFMNEHCPHLQQMEEPLTLEQYRELQKKYHWRKIEKVLKQMENKVNVYRDNRSCYETALSWLDYRFGQNNNQ